MAGEYKAVLELAHAMGSQLRRAGAADIKGLAESDFRRRIRYQIDGGRIGYEYRCNTEEEIGRDADACLSSWIRKEMWWLIFIFATLPGIFFLSLMMNGRMVWVLVGLLVTLILTICIGTTRRSRGVLFFWIFLVSCVMPLLVFLFLFILKKATSWSGPSKED